MSKYNRRRSKSPLPTVDALPAQSMPGELLQFQLNCLIREILAQDDLNPDMRASLLRHFAMSPKRPELVLLAHLRDIQDPNDLPPD